jgi:3-hydroxyisobutyrate dehydrogenase
VTKELYIEDIYAGLKAAVVDAKHNWHDFCFANVNSQSSPEARVVILRDFCENSRNIIFHTDVRSAKCSQIAQNPESVALFYDRASKIQLKFKGTSKLHYKDDIAYKRWEKTTLTGRRTYLKHHSPGSVISKDDHILPDQFLSHTPNIDQSEAGFENFAVVVFNFYSLEILKLHHKGNECFKAIWDKGQETFYRLAP